MTQKLCQSYGCHLVAEPDKRLCKHHDLSRHLGLSPRAASAYSTMMQFANANPDKFCTEPGCHVWAYAGTRHCVRHLAARGELPAPAEVSPPPETMADKYPKYYKTIPKGWNSMDTYAVNKLFPVDDPSGCILHARKKLLVPGTRTGGKSMRKDITEARDTLNRWLELNPE